jgi:hypothetical protein
MKMKIVSPVIEIDGSEIRAFLYELRIHATEGMMIRLSCWQYNGPGLSLPREDIVPVVPQAHEITVSDGLGMEAKYHVQLSRIESHEEVGQVPSVDYFFTLSDVMLSGQINDQKVPAIEDIRSSAKLINPDLHIPEGE